jgi:hypothetical protein
MYVCVITLKNLTSINRKEESKTIVPNTKEIKAEIIVWKNCVLCFMGFPWKDYATKSFLRNFFSNGR